MSNPVSLIPMNCVKCQNQISAQPDEVVWVCEMCGQGQILDTEKGLQPLAIHYSAGIAPNTKGKPVWLAAGNAALRRDTYRGNESGAMQSFWSQPRWFYIPAYTLPLEQLLQAGVQLLQQPVPVSEVPTASPFFPVTVLPQDVKPLAEFIVMALEAGRRDDLKQLDINLTLQDPQLWILP